MKEIAAGLASLGRGPDTMLVHMAPEEVAGLQKLALAHGGSLTTNPQTGLPEAGFLKNILPTVLGVGLSFMGVPAWAAGLGVGGLQAARTGDIGKGLMAGLGAFGGAGLGGALSGMGQGAATQGWLGAQNVADAATPGAMAGQVAELMPYQANPAMLGSQRLGDAYAGLKQVTQPGGMSQLGSGLMGQFGGKMGATAAGIGALGAMGGFDQPQSGFAMPGQEPSNYRKQVANRRPYDPTAPGGYFFTDRGIVQPNYGYAEGGSIDMKDGGFVVPADVVSHLGNGDTDAGLRKLMQKTGAAPIKGDGDGMADRIRASINGSQPALVAAGEAYIDRPQVARIGGGDQQRGAKKLYAMMDKVRQARTGSTKQGRQINPDRFIPA